MTINGNITRNITDYMKDYNSFYVIGVQSTESSLWFKSLEKTKIRDYYEVETSKQAFYFQVILGTGQTLDSIVEPCYKGWIYFDLLSQYETRFYRHAKWTNQKTNAYIISKSGAIEVFQATCTSFPYCWDIRDMKMLLN